MPPRPAMTMFAFSGNCAWMILGNDAGQARARAAVLKLAERHRPYTRRRRRVDRPGDHESCVSWICRDAFRQRFPDHRLRSDHLFALEGRRGRQRRGRHRGRDRASPHQPSRRTQGPGHPSDRQGAPRLGHPGAQTPVHRLRRPPAEGGSDRDGEQQRRQPADRRTGPARRPVPGASWNGCSWRNCTTRRPPSTSDSGWTARASCWRCRGPR